MRPRIDLAARSYMPLDPDDLTRLYDRHAGAMLAFLVRNTYDPEAAVDLLAETFAEAFEDRERFRGTAPGAARAWLFAIARHRLVDYFRRGQVERRALRALAASPVISELMEVTEHA